MLDAIGELVSPAAVASSILFGGMIGALYGYELAPQVKPRFPISLWAIGIGFIVLVTIVTVNQVDSDPERITAFGIARAILWSFLIAAIPVGRIARGWIASRRN